MFKEKTATLFILYVQLSSASWKSEAQKKKKIETVQKGNMAGTTTKRENLPQQH